MSKEMFAINNLLSTLKCTEQDYESYNKVKKLILLEDIMSYVNKNINKYSELDLMTINDNIEKIIDRYETSLINDTDMYKSVYNIIEFYLK